MGKSNLADTSRKTISAIVICKNEEEMIANCLATLSFCDEIIVVDSGSTDNTVEIARREQATVITADSGNFASWRNLGKTSATGDWLLYIDCDERVTPKLAQEIIDTIQYTSVAAFALRRNNIHFGKWLEYGGWEADSIVRLFKRDQLRSWEGEVHEHSNVEGVVGLLGEPLVHLTHRNIRDGLVKSYHWTDAEARLLLEAGTRPVKPLTLVRKFLMEFIRRLILKKGYRDGMEGWIEAFQQAINRFFVYERLWELQQKPSLKEKYARIEQEIVRLWGAKKKL